MTSSYTSFWRNNLPIRTCPQCGKVYQTELERPEGDNRPIQQIFPDESRWKKEQLISGVCCQRCWNLYLWGVDSDKEINGPEDLEDILEEYELPS
jgi:endogenous inhibitor of DNA gyrase (YacG/DUF329 family)